MSPTDTVARTTDLVKVFTDFWRRPKVRAVDGVDLNIRRGEVFGLLGPNGSGKSTTIKILLDLLHPTAGTASLFDLPPASLAAKRRIGYLPEETHLYNYLTARETVRFCGRLFDLPETELRERTDQLLTMVGLADAADRTVGELSKGMARRVGLAQALINKPELLILDEPTSGLDPIGCREVKDLILALARHGTTVLLSSHFLADVEDVCDRIAILYGGRVCAEGRVRDLLESRDHIRLTLPVAAEGSIAEILKILRQQTGATAEVDHPAIQLERFFLNVIEQAHREKGRSSGAVRSPGIAPFLTRT